MTISLLVAVVSDPLEEQAIAIAREEGAHGVTIVPARGIGFPEHMTFFGLTYRGLEKTLLWLLDRRLAERIAERLNRELDLLAPQRGLAFCLPVGQLFGIDPALLGEGRAAPGSADD
jgi:hypothetical protein